MGEMNLSSLLVTPQLSIETTGGNVMHGLNVNDNGYSGFGEAYFSWIAEGAIKGWKRHTKMTMNLLVPVGKVRFVFRIVNHFGKEEFRVEDIGFERYARITVPPGIWFGFLGLHSPQNLVLNISNIPHDPNEVDRLELTDIIYDWSIP